VEALLAGTGGAEEIAARAGAGARATANWLAVMVAAGYATHTAGRFSVADDAVPFLSAQVAGVDSVALLDFALALGTRTPHIVEATRAGAAFPGLFAGDFGAAVVRTSAPMYRNALLPNWIAAAPTVGARLEAGARVVDVGCGDGTAVRVLGAAYPASSFVGVDADPDAVAVANRRESPDNVSFSAFEPEAADVILVLDSFHHFSRPDELLARWRSALRDDGVLVVAEPSWSGELDVDASDRGSVVGLACTFLYCDVEGRTGEPDLEPISPLDGGGALRAALAAAGFDDVVANEVANGYRLYVAR
jgi:SAM-dependent methyltransferase